MTVIINLLGAPGAGKSTLAAGLFAEMKRNYKSVELVTEYAKDLVYDGHRSEDMDPLSVFAEQHRRIARLIGKVEWVVTDSPLYLSAYYAHKASYPQEFGLFVHRMAARYVNKTFLVKRTHHYDPTGRSQTEQESDMIHDELIAFMRFWKIPFEGIDAGDGQPRALYNMIFNNMDDVPF